MLNTWLYSFVSPNTSFEFFKTENNFSIDDDKCASCPGILEELENIDDDTDKHGIQFVKSNDVKLAHEIGIFAFPALVYYETGVPIMYDGRFSNKNSKNNKKKNRF